MMNNDNGDIQGESAKEIMVVFNAAQEEKSFLIGSGEWEVCAQGLKAGTASLEKVDGSKNITIEPLSAMILVRGDETIVAADDKNAGGNDTTSSDSGNGQAASGNTTSGDAATASNAAAPAGNKAGLAAAIVAGVLAIAAAIAFFFKKK